MNPKLDLARYIDAEDPNALGYMESYSLELWRYDERILLCSERTNLCLLGVRGPALVIPPLQTQAVPVFHALYNHA